MLMYKVKTKNDIFLYRDLAECPILENIIQKPEGCEITELYMDRNGKVCIKRPIPISYIQEILAFLSDILRKEPGSKFSFLVKLRYSIAGLEGGYALTDDRDACVIAAKSACMMSRVISDTAETQTPYITVEHPSLGKRSFILDKYGRLGVLHGVQMPFGGLSCRNVYLVDCLSGKTVTERELLRNLDDRLPQWRQGYNRIASISCLFTLIGTHLTPEIADSNFFMPTELRFGNQRYDLESLDFIF